MCSSPKPYANGQYLSPKQLAHRWNRTVAALAAMRHQKQGPDFVRIGRQVRYSVEAVEAYEESRTVRLAR